MCDSNRALALILDMHLSKRPYLIMRASNKLLDVDIYPSYNDVLEAKKNCYPPNLDIAEKHARVKLQDLLNHSASRLILSLPAVTNVDDIPPELTLFSRYGCDSSADHNQHERALTDGTATDASIFMTFVAPLQLRRDDGEAQWRNPVPASTRWCRPLRIELKKESREVILYEVEQTMEEIGNLTQSVVTINGRTITIEHDFRLTMIDGKIAQTLCGDTSMQTCCICGAEPNDMNNLSAISQRPVSSEAPQIGLQPLHARIKAMECFLDIAYRLPFRERGVKEENGPVFEERKKRIQEEIKSLGIYVDFVNLMGSTNDDDTASRFFEAAPVISTILGVDETLLHRVGVILDAISCNLPVNTKAFAEYTRETAERYVDLYPWYKMPNSLHKVLMHGTLVAETLLLPVVRMSEEAQESCNELYKIYRADHAMTDSRIATNRDVMQMLFAASDPYVNSLRTELPKKTYELTADVEALIALD